MCLSSTSVVLAKPIGTRKVIDDGTRRRLSVSFALPGNLVVPQPGWLPDGWAVTSESSFGSAAQSAFGSPQGTDGILLWLMPAASSFTERFRGATTIRAGVVQGRPAAWRKPPDLVDGKVLMVGDDQWVLTLEDSRGTVDEAIIEQFANSLTPLPFTSSAVDGPTPVVPAAWSGSVADLVGKEGRGTATGWLVVDVTGAGMSAYADIEQRWRDVRE